MTLDIDDYKLIEYSVSKAVNDAMWALQGPIDKTVAPATLEAIKVDAPDHNDVTHTIFHGIIPSLNTTMAVGADRVALIGYDQGWYLTVQYVPEYLRTIDIDQNPALTITKLLGEDPVEDPDLIWEKVTGIEPHRINNIDDWEDIKKAFEFGNKCTRWKAIQEICEHCNFVFEVKWREVAGILTPSAYCVHDDTSTIDNDLDLPAMVTVTNPDGYMMSGIKIDDSPEHQYNRVNVYGYDGTNALSAMAQTPAAASGVEIAIEYIHGDKALDTQDKVSAKAQDLLDFFQDSYKVYTARFKRRMDFKLGQKIKFMGYSEIPHGVEMRIMSISYNRSVASDIVKIKFSKDQAQQQLKRLARAVEPEYVRGERDIINDSITDFGLIDEFDDPIGGIGGGGLWEVDGSYTRLVDGNSIINAGGWLIDNCTGLRGPEDSNVSLWGWDSTIGAQVEYLKWMTAANEIAIGGYKLTGLADGVEDDDAATVGQLGAGSPWKTIDGVCIYPDPALYADMRGQDIIGIHELKGKKDDDFVIWGGNPANDDWEAFLSWDHTSPALAIRFRGDLYHHIKYASTNYLEYQTYIRHAYKIRQGTSIWSILDIGRYGGEPSGAPIVKGLFLENGTVIRSKFGDLELQVPSGSSIKFTAV